MISFQARITVAMGGHTIMLGGAPVWGRRLRLARTGAELEASSWSALGLAGAALSVALVGLALGAALSGDDVGGALTGGAQGARLAGMLLVGLAVPLWACEAAWIRGADGTRELLRPTPASSWPLAVGLAWAVGLRGLTALAPALAPTLWVALLGRDALPLRDILVTMAVPLGLAAGSTALAWALRRYWPALAASLILATALVSWGWLP